MPLLLPRLLPLSKLLHLHRPPSLMSLLQVRLRGSTSLPLDLLTTDLRGPSTSRLRRLPGLLRRLTNLRPLRLPRKRLLLLPESLLLPLLQSPPHLPLLRLRPPNQPKMTESPPSGRLTNLSSSLRPKSSPVDGVKADSTTMPMTRTRRMRSPRSVDSMLLGVHLLGVLLRPRRVRRRLVGLRERARGRS